MYLCIRILINYCNKKMLLRSKSYFLNTRKNRAPSIGVPHQDQVSPHFETQIKRDVSQFI